MHISMCIYLRIDNHMLAMAGAKVYDMDADPARVRKWTELPAVRAYYDFFREHEDDFEDWAQKVHTGVA